MGFLRGGRREREGNGWGQHWAFYVELQWDRGGFFLWRYAVNRKIKGTEVANLEGGS